MSQWSDVYRQKLTTPEEAVKIVKDGDWIDYGMTTSQPVVLDEALAARKDELKDIKVRETMSIYPRHVVEDDPNRETFTVMNWHMSGYDRKMAAQGRMNFIPMCFRNQPLIYRDLIDVDVAMITVAPMDKDGYFNFGLCAAQTESIVKKAKKVIVEINENMPRCLGGRGEAIHVTDVDFIVEGRNQKLPTIPFVTGDEIDTKIAEYIVSAVPDGATLQLGIGGLPNSVGAMIAQSDLKDLGVHTEMLVDAFYLMAKEGRLTNKAKNLLPDKGVFSFCFGSQELYDWIDNNSGMAIYPIDFVNDPAVIGQIDKFISINSCIEVDLFGQVSAESSGVTQISGSGGQLDFTDGAFRSNGGKSIIAMHSTHTNKKTGKVTSNIRPTLMEGTTVTDPRSQTNYIATEYGMVNLMGLSTWERAEALISLAHPDFRDELIKAAEDMKIWRKSNKK